MSMPSLEGMKKLSLNQQSCHLKLPPVTEDEANGAMAVLKLKITANLALPSHDNNLCKDVLLRKIRMVDQEIASFESALVKLKKLEEDLKKGSTVPDCVREKTLEKPMTQAQVVILENRRKALAAHEQLPQLPLPWPLYHQPCDTQVYHENNQRHLLFKDRLLEHLRREKKEREDREKFMVESYTILQQKWRQRLNSITTSPKWKAKEAKYLQVFEKTFPKEEFLKKHLLKGKEKEESDKESLEVRRLSAVIPPLLLDKKQRRYCYINKNSKIDDFPAEYNLRQVSNTWTKEEQDIFKERLLQFPKNFGMIASGLQNKSLQDCVQHYYLTKKEENYKQTMRKSRRRRKVNNAKDHLIEGVIKSETGVMTRQQFDQFQKHLCDSFGNDNNSN